MATSACSPVSPHTSGHPSRPLSTPTCNLSQPFPKIGNGERASVSRRLLFLSCCGCFPRLRPLTLPLYFLLASSALPASSSSVVPALPSSPSSTCGPPPAGSAGGTPQRPAESSNEIHANPESFWMFPPHLCFFLSPSVCSRCP